MIVRLTYVNILPENKDEVKRIFNNEIIPVVRQQKGSLGIVLLEPTDIADDYISVTRWETQADADAYHSSGTYKELVGKVKDKFTRKPELKTYTSETVDSTSKA